MVSACEATCLKVTNRNEADENEDESDYEDNGSQKACSHERPVTAESDIGAVYINIHNYMYGKQQ